MLVSPSRGQTVKKLFHAPMRQETTQTRAPLRLLVPTLLFKVAAQHPLVHARLAHLCERALEQLVIVLLVRQVRSGVTCAALALLDGGVAGGGGHAVTGTGGAFPELLNMRVVSASRCCAPNHTSLGMLFELRSIMPELQQPRSLLRRRGGGWQRARGHGARKIITPCLILSKMATFVMAGRSKVQCLALPVKHAKPEHKHAIVNRGRCRQWRLRCHDMEELMSSDRGRSLLDGF